MQNRIAQALAKQFERHRIVFWYDAKKELRADFEELSLPSVEKVELINNEFGVKHQILREQPDQKFLIYREGPQPADLENWLLDVQLAHAEFRTDQVALWLSDLELGIEFTEVVQAHTEFFQALKRKEALKKLLSSDDTSGQIRLKMLAVCSGSEPRLDSVVEYLLQELAEQREEKIKLISRCGLDRFFWEQMGRCYGYNSDAPGIRDFAVDLFKSCYAMGLDGAVKLNADALVFLKRWKDSRQFENGFETLSKECASVLGIEHDLTKRDFRALIGLDYFDLIDQKIIHELVRQVAGRTISRDEVTIWVRQRRQSHWYGNFEHLYEAIDFSAQFISSLAEAKLEMDSLSDGVMRYTRSWFRIDQLYRKIIFHVRKSEQPTLMGTLMEQIENLYTNNFLLKLGDSFQVYVDSTSKWEALPVRSQNDFFETWVHPYLRKDNKVCVIVSDAMRYEIGDELLSRIRQEDRYSAELEPALSMLPSYTQLGMAALLPNKELEINDNDSGTVMVNGQSSQGTANRTKILKAALDGRGEAILFEDFMQLEREASRDLLKQNDVIYVYHNRIDHTGDKMHSEGQAFEAAEHTLDDLVKLIKKLTASNASNILVTADHGFIYQHRPLDESDFSNVEAKGDVIHYRDRRFVLGKGLIESSSLHKFGSAKLGLKGDVEVQIPRSINRLRLKGSGSRFVHGGATLQEVVIPIIKINKKRQSDVVVVEVDILPGSSSTITSGQVTVTLYQTSPVSDKVQTRLLRAGIFTESGELISDSHELKFDLSSENPRGRELQIRFLLTRKADDVNGKDVFLRLEEKHAGTSHFKEYKSIRYLMRRSFTSDFDL